MIDSDKIQRMRLWGRRKITLQREYESNKESIDNKTIIQGGIYNVNFGINMGSEMDKNRPAIVVSNQSFNNRKNGIVVVVPLTGSVIRKANGSPKYNYHFILEQKEYPFLDKDSAIQFNHIRSISSKRIDSENPKGFISGNDLVTILNKLKRFF